MAAWRGSHRSEPWKSTVYPQDIGAADKKGCPFGHMLPNGFAPRGADARSFLLLVIETQRLALPRRGTCHWGTTEKQQNFKEWDLVGPNWRCSSRVEYLSSKQRPKFTLRTAKTKQNKTAGA